jgi:integrase/recombinase XerD
MTPLRAKYIRDLTIRGRAQRTQPAYTRYVSELARYYQRSPELISYEEVSNWLYHLVTERQLSASSVNVAVNAVRFLYGITLGRNTEALTASVPHMKHPIRRAEVYARSELCEGCRERPNCGGFFRPRKSAIAITYGPFSHNGTRRPAKFSFEKSS